MFVKIEQRNLARRLRREHGMAIKEIATAVGVSVSSVSLWVRDIELTPDQQAALAARNPILNGQLVGTRNNAHRRRDARREAQAHGAALARSGDSAYASGCMLYWAEGAKSRNHVTLTNSDPDLLDFFVRFLRRYYEVADGQFAFRVNCFLNNGLTLDEIHRWWLGRLSLPESALRKSAVNRPSSASQRKKHRRLVYGTAAVIVHSTFVVQSIYGAIQEIAGIERPEWLDL